MRPAKLRSQGRAALSLPELVVSMFVFGLLMVVAALALRQSTSLWDRASGGSGAQLELRKGYGSLVLDLERTSQETVRTAPGPITLAGRDGDALWFLSPLDPVSGAPLRTSEGRPFWQRNILYYTVVPNGHQALYGSVCQGGADAQGYEHRCPHKMLIRKVIDHPPATDANDEAAAETLITDITPYLTRPNGYDTSAMNEPGLQSAEVRAQSLLTFRAAFGPDTRWPGEVLLDLRAVRIEEARRLARIGTDDLGTWVQQFTFSVFPAPPPLDHELP